MRHASDMSFPPPPNDAPPPGQGGGFGPPQGFGPPPPPNGGGYGQQPPAPGGYGPPPPGGPAGPAGYGPTPPPGSYGPGGYGPYPPPPPPPGGGKGPKVAAAVVGVVVVAAIVIGGIVWQGSGNHDNESKGDTPASASASPDGALPGDDQSADPGESFGDPQASASSRSMPYVKLDAGTCFDSPSLDSTVTEITSTSCDSAHDGEVITNESLSGLVSSEDDLREKALALCAPDAKKRLESIPDDGRIYYNYALYPDMTTYQMEGEDTVSCALTLSNSQDGTQLTEPLP